MKNTLRMAAVMLLISLTFCPAVADAQTFNFGPGDAVVPDGVINTGSLRYDASRGWGWEKAADILRQRGKQDDVLKDTLAATSNKVQPEAVFVVDLEPGEYTIEACLSDPQFRFTAKVFLQAEATAWIDAGLQPAGSVVTKTRTLRIDDGQLRVRLPGAPTAGTAYAILSSLKIASADGGTTVSSAEPQPATPSSYTGPVTTRAIPTDVDADQMLPPSARDTRFDADEHPLHRTFNSFLDNQRARVTDFEPTGLDKTGYLRLINGTVTAMTQYQDNSGGELDGEIVDPWFRPGQYRHYGTPHYAYCVAVLHTSGYNTDPELLKSGVRAFERSVLRMKRGRKNRAGLQAWSSGDFYTYVMMRALPLYKELVPTDQYGRWARDLSQLNPEDLYAQQFAANNWSVLNGCGEFLRAAAGLTDMAWAEKTLEVHKNNFSDYGTFAREPFAYDVFPRYYVAGILQAGYHGKLFEHYRDRMWRGAWLTLFLQTPQGQLVTGSRSAHHVWNEAQLCKLFELYAAAYQKAGMTREAGTFKRAARLAMQSMAEWVREDGSFCVVKNWYPPEVASGPAMGHAYEEYTQHTCYNMLAASMLGVAWQLADDTISERPAPPDVGGFAFRLDEHYRSWFAAASDTYVQYSIKGDGYYDPTGLQRIHFAGTDPILAPSDGVGRKFGNHESVYAVGPGWTNAAGERVTLAQFERDPAITIHEQSPGRVVLEAQYQISGAAQVPAGAGRVPGVVKGGEQSEGALVFAQTRGFLQTDEPVVVGDGDFFFSMRFRTGDLRGPEILAAVHEADDLRGHLIICEMHPGGRMRMLYRCPPGTGGGVDIFGDGSAATDGAWHHIAFGRAGDTVQVWLDGSKIAEAEAPATTDTPMTLLFGQLFQDRADRNWTGTLDDIRYYDTALAAPQIAALAGGGDPAGAAALLDWPLDNLQTADAVRITERVEIEPGEVRVTDTFSGPADERSFYYPYVYFDGYETTEREYARNDAVVLLDAPRWPEPGVRVEVVEPSGATFAPMGLRLVHENGLMDVLRARTDADRITVRIQAGD